MTWRQESRNMCIGSGSRVHGVLAVRDSCQSRNAVTRDGNRSRLIEPVPSYAAVDLLPKFVVKLLQSCNVNSSFLKMYIFLSHFRKETLVYAVTLSDSEVCVPTITKCLTPGK